MAAVLLFALSAHILVKKVSFSNVCVSFFVFVFFLIEVVNLFTSSWPIQSKVLAVLPESFIPLASLLFGIAYRRKEPLRGMPAAIKALAFLALLFPVSAVLLPDGYFFPSPVAINDTLVLGVAGYWFYFGIMLYCIVAMFNLEATFRVITGVDRWKIKFEVIGFGAILSVLVFYYSQSLLYHGIKLDFIPARSGVFIISALLIFYSRLFRGNGISITVSRYILYRSFAALIVGGYMISLGLIGAEVKYFGITFGGGIIVFVAFAAGILMALLFLSEQFRREIKVFIGKNFFAQKHDYRVVWLSFTDRLAGCQTLEEVEDSILATFMDVFGLRGAALYLYSKGRGAYVLSSRRFMSSAADEARFSSGLVSYFLEKDRVFNPDDGEYTPTDEEASFFRGAGACLAAPLAAGSELPGFIVLGKQLVPEKLTYEDFDVMKRLAKQSSVALKIFRLSEELAQAREVAAVAKMSSFVIHDLKNLTSSLSLMLENSKDHISNPEFQKDMVLTVRNTLTKMLDLIRRLKKAPDKNALKPEPADLYDLVKSTADEISKSGGGRTAIVCGGTHVSARVDTEEIKKVIINLLLNSIEAAGADGRISLETGKLDGHAFIRAKDNGCGMSRDFIQNGLFRPFVTTKKKGLGIGLYQCKQIIEAHGGKIEVESERDRGTTFTIYLPV